MRLQRTSTASNTKRAALLAIPLALLTGGAGAQENIRLNCSYEYTIDARTGRNTGETSGSFSLEIGLIAQGNGTDDALINSTDGPCFTYAGQATSLQITGQCEAQTSHSRIGQELYIDRTSGAFKEHFILNGKLGLIHHGRCLPAKKLF